MKVQIRARQQLLLFTTGAATTKSPELTYSIYERIARAPTTIDLIER